MNPTELTFETGYTRLQQIAQRLSEEEVPVSEMCDLFAEGKGLEQALTSYLDEQRARIESIEKGDGIRAFRVVPPSTGQGSGTGPEAPFGSVPARPVDDDIQF